jgi:Mg2+ and Co2+ transporter CorA
MDGTEIVRGSPGGTGGDPDTEGPGFDRAQRADVLYIARATEGDVSVSSSLTDLTSFVSDDDAITWIDLTDPSAELVGEVARELGIHPLVVEDIVDTDCEQASVRS